jgi:hypothetical protein
MTIRHGFDCQKVSHTDAGYLHGMFDDRPYDVDGVSYCGRCHGWMGTSVYGKSDVRTGDRRGDGR